MGLRCLIGHDFGTPQTTRATRERGNEVVVTVREYRECTRCGYQRIISENKEVTAVPSEEPEEAPADEFQGAETTSAAGAADFEVPSAGSSGGLGGREEITAEEDDGIILEDEPAQASRGHGEWPADHPEETADDADGTDGDSWSDRGPADTGFDAEPTGEDDDSVAVHGNPPAEDPDRPADVGGAGGDDADGEIIDAEAHTVGDEGTDADRPGKFAGQPDTRPDNRDTEFVCPECGETWPTVDASLRPGDICPRCREGYLAEQVVQ